MIDSVRNSYARATYLAISDMTMGKTAIFLPPNRYWSPVVLPFFLTHPKYRPTTMDMPSMAENEPYSAIKLSSFILSVLVQRYLSSLDKIYISYNLARVLINIVAVDVLRPDDRISQRLPMGTFITPCLDYLSLCRVLLNDCR